MCFLYKTLLFLSFYYQNHLNYSLNLLLSYTSHPLPFLFSVPTKCGSSVVWIWNVPGRFMCLSLVPECQFIGGGALKGVIESWGLWFIHRFILWLIKDVIERWWKLCKPGTVWRKQTTESLCLRVCLVPRLLQTLCFLAVVKWAAQLFSPPWC